MGEKEFAMPSSKQCFKCREVRPLSEFYRHPAMADGLLGKCKDCTKKDVTENRGKNIDRIRAYDRERAKNPERAKQAAIISSRWRRSDKRICAAHNAATRAVRSGAIVRGPCERCGRPDAYGHHENYDKKLDVTWLCQPCHKKRHKEMAIAGIFP